MAGQGTRAVEVLRRDGVEHTVHEYEPPARAGRARDERPNFGLEAAEALGVPADRVHKTLVVTVDGSPALAIVPVSGELDPKACATALLGRRCELAAPAEAERATGYVIGGISPIGTRRRLPTVLDEGALRWQTVHVSAGRRGLQVELTPADLVRVTGAVVRRVTR